MAPKQPRATTPGTGHSPVAPPKAKPGQSGPQLVVATTTPFKDATLKDHSPTAVHEHPTSNPTEHSSHESHIVAVGYKRKGFPILGHHIPDEWDVKPDIKDVNTFVRTITSTTIENVKSEASSEVHKITESVVELVTHGKKDSHEYPDGVHFLDQLMVTFERDFLHWKSEHVFPKIKDWLRVIVAEYVQTLIDERTKTIIKQFEEIITIVERGYEERLEEVEKAHRLLLIKIVQETWAAYRAKMEVEVVKEIRVRLAMEAEMDFDFSRIVAKVVPEIAERAPNKYHPEVTMKDFSKVKTHSGAVIHHTGVVLEDGEHHHGEHHHGGHHHGEHHGEHHHVEDHVEQHSSEAHHVQYHSEQTTNTRSKQKQSNGFAK